MHFDKRYGIFLIIAVAILGMFFFFTNPTSFAIQEDSIFVETPKVLDGQEIESKGYKYSNTKGVILSTLSEVSCSWKNPESDDGWKICEVVFEVNNADKATKFLESPRIDLSFENTNNIKNVEVLYSNNFEVIDEVYKEYKTEIVQVEEPSQLKNKNSLITGNVISEENENKDKFSRENKVKLVVKEEEEIIERRNFENFFEFSEVNIADRQGNIKQTISQENYQKGFFGNLAGKVVDGFEKDPSSINTKEPFAVMVRFEIPKYDSNSFDFSLIDEKIQAFIDPDVSACGTLDTENAVYTLTQDISSTGNCFTIGATNVTLDCQDYNITYATSGSGGYGVFSNLTHTKIRNCNFIEGNSGNLEGKGIYLSGSNNAEISSNTFYSQASEGFAFYVSSSEDVLIQNNILNISGSYFQGIYADSNSDYIIVKNNLINFSSVWGGAGIYFEELDSGVAFRNTIYVLGTPGNSGISFQTTTNSNASDNTIFNSGDSSYGTYISEGSNDVFSRNSINATGFSSDGIYADDSSSGLTVDNNILSTSGGGGVGVYFGESLISTINDNSINSLGTDDYGIIISGSEVQTTIQDNTLNTYGDSVEGIIIEESATALIINNVLNINGANSFGVSSYSEGGEINLTSNTITISSDDSSGIQIQSSPSNTFFYNLIFDVSGSNSKAVYVYDGLSYFKSFDTKITSGSLFDFVFYSTLSGSYWNLTNTTISNKNWTSSSNGNLRVYWYLDALVKYSNGTLIQGATVTGVNTNAVQEFSESTNSQGEINKQTLLSYLQTGESTIDNYSNFNISASFGSFYSSELVNLNENKDLIFTFGASSGEGSSEESSDVDSIQGSDWEKKCNPKWKCSKWSDCDKKGVQKRICTNNNPSCNIEKPKTEKKCTSKGKIKKVLFDIKLDPLKKRVVYGEDLFVAVSLFNLGVPGRVNVSLSYEITNSLGEFIYTEEENMGVETQIEFIKEFDLSGLPLGEYDLSADLEYEEQTEPARAQVRFIIREERNAVVVALIILGFLAFLGLIIYFLVFWKPKKKHTFFYGDIKERISQAKGKEKQERKTIYESIREDFNELNEKEKEELLPKIEKLTK